MSWTDLQADILREFAAYSKVTPFGYSHFSAAGDGYSFGRHGIHDWTATEARAENPAADPYLTFVGLDRDGITTPGAIAASAIAGAAIKSIARETHRRPDRVAAIVHEMRGSVARTELSNLEVERAVRLASAGESVSMVSAAINRSESAVRRAVAGVLVSRSRMIDITSQRFGRLTATRFVGGARSRWQCACDCGGETVVESYKLRSGLTRSCGCLQREIAALPPAERKAAAGG